MASAGNEFGVASRFDDHSYRLTNKTTEIHLLCLCTTQGLFVKYPLLRISILWGD